MDHTWIIHLYSGLIHFVYYYIYGLYEMIRGCFLCVPSYKPLAMPPWTSPEFHQVPALGTSMKLRALQRHLRRPASGGVERLIPQRGYPLVMTNIAVENGHRNSGFSH
jgi:hypothetical protein